MENNCVYVQDLIIGNPCELAVLCLLYDKISLPHPYDHDPSCEAVMSISFKNEDYREIERNRYLAWKESYRELFDHNVISVLPSPLARSDFPSDLERRLCEKIGPTTLRLGTSDVLYGRIALAMYAVFGKRSEPEFTMAGNQMTSTAVLRVALAEQAIGWRAPLLPAITPEQILELRERTMSFREGFRLYLAVLAEDVENRMKSGLDRSEAARRTFERLVEPEVAQFIRMRLPEQAAWWSAMVKDVASAGTQVVKAITTGWNIGNIPKIGETIASIGEKTAKRVAESRSNKNQAFQFLGAISSSR